MFTGKNEFKEQVLFSITDTELTLEDYDIENEMACYVGNSNDTDLIVYCSYYDDRDQPLKNTLENLLECDYLRIYFDGECVLWVR